LINYGISQKITNFKIRNSGGKYLERKSNSNIYYYELIKISPKRQKKMIKKNKNMRWEVVCKMVVVDEIEIEMIVSG